MNIDIKEMKKDLVEYDLYYLLDAVKYDDYYLTIVNNSDSIIIVVEDTEGSASLTMSKDDFLNISTTEELEKHINAILYYNYIKHGQ